MEIRRGQREWYLRFSDAELGPLTPRTFRGEKQPKVSFGQSSSIAMRTKKRSISSVIPMTDTSRSRLRMAIFWDKKEGAAVTVTLGKRWCSRFSHLSATLEIRAVRKKAQHGRVLVRVESTTAAHESPNQRNSVCSALVETLTVQCYAAGSNICACPAGSACLAGCSLETRAGSRESSRRCPK